MGFPDDFTDFTDFPRFTGLPAAANRRGAVPHRVTGIR